MAKKIYLDNGITSKPSSKAVAAMLPFYTEKWGTLTQPHKMGEELVPYLEGFYRPIYTLLGCSDAYEFILCSSGAEAINQVLLSTYFEVTKATGKNQYITSNIEEAPILMSIGRLESLGCVGKMLNVSSSGRVTKEDLLDLITPRTALVSLSYANGQTGVIQPIEEIAAVCQEKGILLHVDATHAIGKVYFELSNLPINYLTFSGETFHAPRGIGGLCVAPGAPLSGLILGGIEQDGKRAGNMDVAHLAALGQAAIEAIDARDLMWTEVSRLRNHLEALIQEGYPEAVVLFSDQERLATTTAIAFPGIVNESLLFSLNNRGVYASIGGGSSQQIGLILHACHIKEPLASCAISFTLSQETTEEEIERAAKEICEAASKIRRYSKEIV